jgi:ketosteroid isomerase-like protein
MILSSRDFENNVDTTPPKKGATAICCEQDRESRSRSAPLHRRLSRCFSRRHYMPDTTNTKSDLEILTQLNADFLASAQNGDVRRYEQILAEDFMASLPDFLLRDKKQFLDMMAAPRPFTELKADEVRIRLLGDFAIIHAHMTLRTADGVQRQGRYTDDWQRRDRKWLCVAANAFWEP